MGMPPIVLPLRIPWVSPTIKPQFKVEKWQTRSGNPSALTSSGLGLQKAKLVSVPLWPKVKDVWSTWLGASKPGVDKMATGMVPLLLELMELG